jgi:hypothetical protein
MRNRSSRGMRWREKTRLRVKVRSDSSMPLVVTWVCLIVVGIGGLEIQKWVGLSSTTP